MNPTIVIAAMGFATTLLATMMSAHLQRNGDREARLLEARVCVYGECSDSLYEYARTTYNRAKSGVQQGSRVDMEPLEQEAYRCNARARSAIGQALILSRDHALAEKLSRIRHDIGELNDAETAQDLKRRQSEVYERLKVVLEAVGEDLTD